MQKTEYSGKRPHGSTTVRVLFLHRFDRMGGAERALLALVREIQKENVEPLLLWPRKDAAYRALQEQGVRCAILNVPGWRRPGSLPLIPLAVLRLRRLLDTAAIDILHVNNFRAAPIGLMASRWAGIPCVSHVREQIPAKRIEQFWLRSCDFLIAVSRAVQDILLKEGLPRDRTATVYSGLDVSTLPADPVSHSTRKALGIAPDDPVVGIVAHILPHKGYDDLFQALALVKEKFPRVKCLIVGHAPRRRYTRRLQGLAERLSIRKRLIFAGFQEDVYPFLGAMDLFVLPSLVEGQGIALLEAMAMRRPVVATSVGGIPEVVRDGETGILIQSRDPEGLAEAVIRLLEAPRLARAMGEEGRKRVEALFTMEAEAERTSMVYRQVLAASQAASL